VPTRSSGVSTAPLQAGYRASLVLACAGQTFYTTHTKYAIVTSLCISLPAALGISSSVVHIKCCIGALVLLGAFSYVQIGRIRSALLGVTSATRVCRLFAGGRSNLSLVFVGTERLIQEQSCTCYEKAYNPLIADLRFCYSDPQRTYPRT